jgi:Spy/CpxP family protein refolding chaperone
MRISFLKIALAVSLAFNISVLGAAGYFYFAKSNSWVSPLGVRTQKGKFLFEELPLRPDQMKRMRERAMSCRAEIDRKRQEIDAKRNHLFTLMRADTPDRHAIKATLSEISGMRAEMEGMVTARILEVKASLEKDQQKKFLELIENAVAKGRQPGCPSEMQNQ